MARVCPADLLPEGRPHHGRRMPEGWLPLRAGGLGERAGEDTGTWASQSGEQRGRRGPGAGLWPCSRADLKGAGHFESNLAFRPQGPSPFPGLGWMERRNPRPPQLQKLGPRLSSCPGPPAGTGVVFSEG